MTTRRTFLLGGTLGCLAAGCSGPDLQPRLVIAGGEHGGLYIAFAELMAERLTRRFPDVSVDVLTTDGSVDNLALIRDGKADLGLALSDVAQIDRHKFPQAAPSAVSRVYENYLQLVVADGSPVASIADLRGLRVSLGASSSGAAVTCDVLLRAAGLRPGVDLRVTHAGLEDGLVQLRDGTVDALAWSGGVPTPALSELDKTFPLRMLGLDRLAGRMRSQSGYPYTSRRVPDVGYSPPGGAHTIGVPNLLLCRRDAPAELIDAVTELMVTDAGHLVPAYVRGLQYLAPPAMIQTGAIPLHPAAVRAYRRLHG
jgi:TRAP transporter TAXI family solute receptor